MTTSKQAYAALSRAHSLALKETTNNVQRQIVSTKNLFQVNDSTSKEKVAHTKKSIQQEAMDLVTHPLDIFRILQTYKNSNKLKCYVFQSKDTDSPDFQFGVPLTASFAHKKQERCILVLMKQLNGSWKCETVALHEYDMIDPVVFAKTNTFQVPSLTLPKQITKDSLNKVNYGSLILFWRESQQNSSSCSNNLPAEAANETSPFTIEQFVQHFEAKKVRQCFMGIKVGEYETESGIQGLLLLILDRDPRKRFDGWLMFRAKREKPVQRCALRPSNFFCVIDSNDIASFPFFFARSEFSEMSKFHRLGSKTMMKLSNHQSFDMSRLIDLDFKDPRTLTLYRKGMSVWDSFFLCDLFKEHDDVTAGTTKIPLPQFSQFSQFSQATQATQVTQPTQQVTQVSQATQPTQQVTPASQATRSMSQELQDSAMFEGENPFLMSQMSQVSQVSQVSHFSENSMPFIPSQRSDTSQDSESFITSISRGRVDPSLTGKYEVLKSGELCMSPHISIAANSLKASKNNQAFEDINNDNNDGNNNNNHNHNHNNNNDNNNNDGNNNNNDNNNNDGNNNNNDNNNDGNNNDINSNIDDDETDDDNDDKPIPPFETRSSDFFEGNSPNEKQPNGQDERPLEVLAYEIIQALSKSGGNERIVNIQRRLLATVQSQKRKIQELNDAIQTHKKGRFRGHATK